MGKSESGIGEDVKILLSDRIETYEELETLLTLFRRGSEVSTTQSISQDLGITFEEAARALDHLVHGNLVVIRVTDRSQYYRYAPGSPSLEASVARLAAAWDSNRLEIIKLMTNNAIMRVRSDASRAFADAFLLRRRKKDG